MNKRDTSNPWGNWYTKLAKLRKHLSDTHILNELIAQMKNAEINEILTHIADTHSLTIDEE